MIKIKEFLSKTSSTLTNLLKKYPLTLIITVLLTVFLTIFIDGDMFKWETIGRIIIFGVVWAISTTFIETLNLKNIKITYILYILTAIIAFVFAKLPNNTYGIFNEHIIRTIIGYCLCLLTTTMYFIIKKENVTFQEYVLKVFNNMFHSSIIYGILSIGITLIIVIFIELILDGDYSDVILRSQILLLGLFYFPAMLNAITDVKESKISNFIKGLVKYVLIPLVTIAMIIIYMYITKILIQGEMPQNVIFRILAGIFIVAFPIWNMANNFKENKAIHKISTILPYAYLPFILLEIYSLGVRIIDFGFTPIRYIGTAFILFQIIALAFTALKKKIKLEYIFIALSVILFIICITPLNCNTVSRLSQKYILESNLKPDTSFKDINDEAKRKVYGAYRYLINNYGKDYIPDYIKNMNNEINDYAPTYTDYRTENIYFSKFGEEIDVREYSSVLPVRMSDYKNGNIELYDYDNKYLTKVNITTIIENAIEANKSSSTGAENYILQNRYVYINEQQTLCITNMNITYNISTNEMIYMSLSGQLLRK